MITLTAERASLQTKILSVEDAKQAKDDTINTLTEERSSLQSQLEEQKISLETTIVSLTEANASSEMKVKNLETERKSMCDEMAALKEEKCCASAKIDSLSGHVGSLEEENETLKSQVEVSSPNRSPKRENEKISTKYILLTVI